jgi:PleD family two-component response regulator
VADLIFETLHEQIGIRASIGIAEYKKTDTIQTLIERADRGQYQVKDTGRNRCGFTKMDQQDTN